MAVPLKITPFLWLPHPQALPAAEFYVSLFNSSPRPHTTPSAITGTTTYTQSATELLNSQNPPAGSIMTVNFTLAGQSFTTLNGPYLPENPQNTLFPFNESISFSIDCEDQEEVDYFWETITKDGGKEVECGWCRDKFGVAWQVIPKGFREMAEGEGVGGEKAEAVKERVTVAMLKMKKFDIKALEEAAREVLEGK